MSTKLPRNKPTSEWTTEELIELAEAVTNQKVAYIKTKLQEAKEAFNCLDEVNQLRLLRYIVLEITNHDKDL